MTKRINAADVFPNSDRVGEVVSPPIPEGPSQAAVLSSDSPAVDVNAVFDGLDDHLATIRSLPVEDRLKAYIPALIDRGMNTRERIVGAARKKNFNKNKTGEVLTLYTGTMWRRGKDGVYSVI